ncbi:TMV resistance protein N-like [Quercus lobata]|uniref:TMV resistance protein N-like n=1 Tax=Quercus lobata TaxID=97700 RepID=UPI0012459C4F|nr:TMV resistance protein N-like [Quercus lobata]XP_030966796.1 TMV resistance protein N-like [Quercus lobata]
MMSFLNDKGASSSFSSTRNYDVFLSFRGEDTREGFTSHLYKSLSDKGFYTFIDDKLRRGEEISEEIIQAIKNSSILVIVFSENYAKSKWCLDELAEIVDCREKDQEVQIRPIFYNVDPSEIRNQKGNFGIALANHEMKFKNNKDKVQRWRDALRKAANASGWHYKKGFGKLSMHDLIQQMGKEVVRQQAPNILRKRSRLCRYEDSLKVLTTNKGSEHIRGIMLHSPQLAKVQLHTKAFRRMENLKFLIVENVHICKPLEFLPNNLILLKWPYYPFHWPLEYFPEQLVAIEMPHSRIRLSKLIKQECRLENLKDVNFEDCELIRILPKLWVPNLGNLNLSYCKNLVKLPKLWAPNLEDLNLRYCENLVEIDECFGYLEKLRIWYLSGCIKLQFLPSQLRLKSLNSFYLTGCSRLEKLPDFHQEMECLEGLYLSGSGIREVPSSIEHLTKLRTLILHNCKNLRDLPNSIYKLRRLWELWTSTTKLRPTCNSFDSSSEGYEAIIELDLLTKPDYFPALEILELFETNIVTIPESICRFPKLRRLSITNCKLLREILGLSPLVKIVPAENCMLLNSQSASGLLNQVIESIGILPNRVCGSARSTNYFPSESEDGDISMDWQFSNHFSFETEGVEYENQLSNRTITFWETEMPKWFNHQSVENSIFFWVGRKFPKLAVGIVLGRQVFDVCVYISINSYQKCEYEYIRHYGNNCNLHLFSPPQRSLQEHLNKSNPTDQNHVKVTYIIHSPYFFDLTYRNCDSRNRIERWGSHVECTCPSQESAIPNLPLLTAGHDDDWW